MARHLRGWLLGGAGIVLPILAVIALTTPAHAAKSTDTIMVGDSITYMGKPHLLELQPSWNINGVPGRRVVAAPGVIRDMLDKYGTPKRLIVALGQNDTAGWTKGDYRALVRLVPKSTRVFFVTPFRGPWPGPEVTGFTEEKWNEKAARQTRYATWMRNIAAAQPNVDAIEWRKACQAAVDPATGNSTLLADQSHPTDPDGRKTWASLINTMVVK
jgi:hypothetical protein